MITDLRREQIEKNIRNEVLKEVEKLIDEHILKDDYMSIDTKQSIKELKSKIQELKNE